MGAGGVGAGGSDNSPDLTLIMAEPVIKILIIIINIEFNASGWNNTEDFSDLS